MRLVDERDKYDATWFDDLEQQRGDFYDLSSAEASEYIEEITAKDETQESTDAQENETVATSRTSRPASPKQI